MFDICPAPKSARMSTVFLVARGKTGRTVPRSVEDGEAEHEEGAPEGEGECKLARLEGDW